MEDYTDSSKTKNRAVEKIFEKSKQSQTATRVPRPESVDFTGFLGHLSSFFDGSKNGGMA